MSSLPLTEWDHSLFDDLQEILARLVAQPTTSLIRRLHARLDEAQPWLLTLTSLPGPSEEAKQHVENDAISLPSGGSVRVTGTLLETTTGISNLLSLSQTLAVVLAVQAEGQRSRYPARQVPEVATYILYDWTTRLLDFLHDLLELTVSPNAESGAPFDALREWINGLLIIKSPIGQGKGEGTLVDQIVAQLDEISARLHGLVGTQRTFGPEFELLSFRVRTLRTQQGKLVGILGEIARGGLLGRGHVVKLLKWLKKCERVDAVVGSVLSIFLTVARSLDMLDPAEAQYEAADEWCRDIKFLKLVSKLVFLEEWSIPRLKEPARLAWSLFILSALRHDSAVQQLEIDPPTAEQYLIDAVNGEVFQFLRQIVMSGSGDRGSEDADDEREGGEDVLVELATRADPANDHFNIGRIQDLLESVAIKKQFLRNLRNKEEDIAIRRSQSSPPAANYQAFLSLAAVIYKSLPPDSAQYLWDNTTFTGAILDSRGSSHDPAFWDMLSAISIGPVCASKAYERIKDTRFPWNSLFKFYQHYYDMMPHLYEPIKSSRAASLDPMTSEEVDICKGWTWVLATVVRWSPLARSALLQAKPYPLQMLFDFVNCDIPVDLKAAVLEAITAFCARAGDNADDEVLSKAVDFYERVSFSDGGLDVRHVDPNRMPAPIGWIAKMEYSEQDVKSYPLTRAYIDFLTSLLPLPTSTPYVSASPRPRLTNAIRRGTSYILDRVLLESNPRQYARDGEKWDTLACIATFVERALLAFNMGELLTQVNNRAIGQIATSLSEEPGFTVLLRLLSESKFFDVLAGVVDRASAIPTPRTSRVNQVLLCALRIYHRVLDIQLIFSDVLLLILSDPTRTGVGAFRRPLGLQSLDHYLLVHLSNVNAIALLVGDDDLAVSLISTKIMTALAASPVFSRSDVFRGEYAISVNRLAGIIDASDDSIRIAQGFCAKLAGEGEDLGNEAIVAVEDAIFRGHIKANAIEALPLVIRSAILDLLVEGTVQDASGPNIAHFLLGFEIKGSDFGLQDPRSPSSRLSCLQVLLDQLGRSAHVSGSPSAELVSLHPLLAAKSARIIYQLFSHSFTGRVAMSYATSVAGFSTRQLAYLPRICPPVSQEARKGYGTAVLAEAVVPTTADTLVAFLDFQRWIISAAALDTFAFDGHGISASAVAELLFRGFSEDGDAPDDAPQGQRPPLIFDLLSSIDVQWREDLSNDISGNRPLDFYGNFDFDHYKRPDANWWDLKALERGLHALRRQLERQGVVTAGASTKFMETEAEYIVERLGTKNRETNISLAKGSFLTAWNEALKVSLALLFQHVSDETQEIVLFELLDELLDRLDDDQPPGVLEILCESVLVAMTSLVNTLVGFDGVNLPVERLSLTLGKIIDAVVRPSTTENARGNLYASITQHLQLLVASEAVLDDAPVAASTIGRESVIQNGSQGMQRATLKVIELRKDRFIPGLCRDAMDDRDVWKTECFTLLGGIVASCHTDRDRQILSPLNKDGFLPLFMRSVKDQEIALQDCLSPDSANLHAYWVYDAKIAFLLSVSATRKGAEDLLDAGVFEVFATCGFLAVSPISDESIDQFSAMEVAERRHQVLISGLQLLARTLASLYRSARSGADHAISFLNAHRESLLMLLRENQHFINLMGIEECRLVVSILAMVVHKVPDDDLRSPSGFGAFHLATLSVAARFFDREAWTDNIANPEEAVRAESQVLVLNQVIVGYLCATTIGLKAGSGYPVFVNGIQRSNGGPTKYIASAPSLYMAVNLLSELAERLQGLSSDYETLVDRLQDNPDLDEADLQKIPDISALNGPVSADSVTRAFTAQSELVSNLTEALLLLIWRHLLFYANDARGALGPVKPDNLSSSLGAFSSSQLDGSRSGAGVRALERIASLLRGTLERLSGVDVHPDLRKKGSSGEKGDAYHGMLVRRLSELTAGLMGVGMDED